MNLRRNILPIIVLFFFFVGILPAQETKQESELAKKLKALPGITEVKEIRFDQKAFTEAYEVMIEQPVDHKNPNGEKFQQRFVLSHNDLTSPVMVETEGYAFRANFTMELTRILGGSQVIVEHRYFGRSWPKEINWKYCTIENSANDLHRIVTALKQIYKGKFVSSGTSKGGQTTCYYKTFFPNDVDASVPYVAPINVSLEDPRIYIHLDTVGTAADRKKILDFQIDMLKRSDEMIPLLKEEIAKKKMTFSRISIEEAYELGLMEYEFTIWQYGAAKPADIPAPGSSKDIMFNHYKKVGGFDFFSDEGIKGTEAFFYQAFAEIGFYNYDIKQLKPYLKYAKDPDLSFMMPPGVKVDYNPATLQKVYHFLQHEAENMIFVYGQYDTWSATGIELTGRTNSIKVVGKEAFHGVRIKQLAPEQKELIYNKLEEWLGVKVNRI